MTGSVKRKVKDEITIDLTQSDDDESSHGSSVSVLQNSPTQAEKETTARDRSLYPEVTEAKESVECVDISSPDDDCPNRSPSSIGTVGISSSSDDDDDTSVCSYKESNKQQKTKIKNNIEIITLSDDDDHSHISDRSSFQNSPSYRGADATVNERSLYPEVAKAKEFECVKDVDVSSSNDDSNIVEQGVAGSISPVVDRNSRSPIVIYDISDSSDHDDNDGTCILKSKEPNSDESSGFNSQNSPTYCGIDTNVNEQSVYPQVANSMKFKCVEDVDVSSSDKALNIVEQDVAGLTSPEVDRSSRTIVTYDISDCSDHDDNDGTCILKSKESNSDESSGLNSQNSPTYCGIETNVNEQSVYPENANATEFERVQDAGVSLSDDASNLVEQDIAGLITPLQDRNSRSPEVPQAFVISDFSDHDDNDSHGACILKSNESSQLPLENSTKLCFPVTPATEPALFVDPDHLSSDRVYETGGNSPNPISLTPEVLEELKKFISNNDAASLMSLLAEDYSSTDVDAVEVLANTLVDLEQEAGESPINVDVSTVIPFSPTENVTMTSPLLESESSVSENLTPAEPSESNSSKLSASWSSSSQGMGNQNRIVPPNERYDMFEVPTYPNFSCKYCSNRFIFKPTMLMHQALYCLKSPNVVTSAPACSNKNSEVGCEKARKVLSTPIPTLIPTSQTKFREETNTQPSKSQDRLPKTKIRRKWTWTGSTIPSRMHFKSKGILSLTPILFYAPRIRIGYRSVCFCKYCKTLFGWSAVRNIHTKLCRLRKKKERHHVCSICRRPFISEYKLKIHQNIDHKDSKRKCLKF